MVLICLLGRHGSGKSTIGLALQSLGYRHISVGLLRRLAQNGHFPSDIPASLMIAMKRALPGQPLSEDIAKKLIAFASTFENCVIDGFPVIQSHVAMLPKETEYFYVWTPCDIRAQRLEVRSETTKRKWTPGGNSERELMLPSIICTIREFSKIHFINNQEKGSYAIKDVASRIHGVKLLRKSNKNLEGSS